MFTRLLHQRTVTNEAFSQHWDRLSLKEFPSPVLGDATLQSTWGRVLQRPDVACVAAFWVAICSNGSSRTWKSEKKNFEKTLKERFRSFSGYGFGQTYATAWKIADNVEYERRRCSKPLSTSLLIRIRDACEVCMDFLDYVTSIDHRYCRKCADIMSLHSISNTRRIER